MAAEVTVASISTVWMLGQAAPGYSMITTGELTIQVPR